MFSQLKTSSWGTFYRDKWAGPGFPQETILSDGRDNIIRSPTPGDFVCEVTSRFLEHRFGVVVESDMTEEDVFEEGLRKSTRVTWNFTVMWASNG